MIYPYAEETRPSSASSEMSFKVFLFTLLTITITIIIILSMCTIVIPIYKWLKVPFGKTSNTRSAKELFQQVNLHFLISTYNIMIFILIIIIKVILSHPLSSLSTTFTFTFKFVCSLSKSSFTDINFDQKLNKR